MSNKLIRALLIGVPLSLLVAVIVAFIYIGIYEFNFELLGMFCLLVWFFAVSILISSKLLTFLDDKEYFDKITITNHKSIKLPELRFLFMELKAMLLTPKLILEIESRYGVHILKVELYCCYTKQLEQLINKPLKSMNQIVTFASSIKIIWVF